MRWSLGKTSLDLFIPIRVHSERLQLHWIRSHQSLEQFLPESLGDPRFGAGGPMVQLTSWPGITPTRIVIWSMKRLSQPATRTLKFSSASWPRGSPCCSLMTRIRVPQVFFEGEVATLSKNSRPTRLCRKTLSKSHKKVSADFACGGRTRTQQTRAVSGSGGQPALGPCLGLDF